MEQLREVSPPRYWFCTVSKATMSKSSLMPYRVIMARASLVACSMSLDAPVELVPNTSSSAARPAVLIYVLLYHAASTLSTAPALKGRFFAFPVKNMGSVVAFTGKMVYNYLSEPLSIGGC